MAKTKEDLSVVKKTEWVKVTLHHNRPTRERANDIIGGRVTPIPKPIALGNARKTDNDLKRDGFEKQLQPLDESLGKSIKLIKPLKSVDNAVRVAETAATDARDQAKNAIDKGLWSSIPASLQTLQTKLTELETAYGTEATRLDAKIDKRLEKLKYFETSLTETGIDAAAVTKAIEDVTKARLAAKSETSNDKRLAAIASAIDQANEAAISAAKSLKAGKSGRVDIGLDSLRSSVATEIAKATNPDEKKRLEGLLTAWDVTRDTAVKQEDPSKKIEAMLACKVALEKLLDDAATASGGNADGVKQAAFKKILETQYGLIIKPPVGHTDTNYEMFSEMLDLLPFEHVWTDSMVKLTYDSAKGSAAYYSGEKKIEMSQFKKDDKATYYDPVTGEKKEMNSFNAYTLHEVAHAVDDRYKIMNPAAMAGDDYGGWQTESLDSTVDALAQHVGGKLTLDEPSLKALIEGALTSGTVPAQNTVSAADWLELEPLLTRCATCPEGKSPWYKRGGAATDTRVYHQAYGNYWVSYSIAGYKNTVEPYQWRAPAEWFAEIYAYSWLTKTVPSGLPSGVSKYLYSAKN